jgi:hypothetical protein
MILKDLPKDKLIKMFGGEKIIYKKFALEYFRHKIFIVNGKKFYDVYNFFNTSLIRVIEILQIDLTDSEKNFVELMKKQRAVFKLKDKDKIVSYSLLENKIGLKIVDKIYSLIPKELQTYALYGSSSLANRFLKDKFQNDLIFNNKIFESAYFGGRMECLKIGTFKNVYKYDINSAYPNVIKDLRMPLTYEIKPYNNKKIVETNIYFVEKFEHNSLSEIGTLPVRLKIGYLVFPFKGGGYYYGCEIIEAQKRKVKLKIKYEIDIKLGEKIFKNNEIEKMYNLRLTYKKNGDLRNLIYKILLNSIYGKFAQSVGAAKYKSLYLAGYITAKVRSQLLAATFGYDKDVIFFATDGILTKKKLNVKVSNNLGDFDFEEIKEAKVILSGIYKLINKENKIKYGERGFRIDFEQVLKDIYKNGHSIVKQKVFISNIYAYKNYKKFLKYRCKFFNITKKIDIKQQHKRFFISFSLDKENSSVLLTDKVIEKMNKLAEPFELEKIIDGENDLIIL